MPSRLPQEKCERIGLETVGPSGCVADGPAARKSLPGKIHCPAWGHEPEDQQRPKR